MHPTTHALLGWLIANSPGVDRRGRIAITLAAVAPDLDGLGLAADLLTARSPDPTDWYGDWHHVLAHNLVAALVAAGLAWAWARRSWRIAALTLFSYLLHIVCDVAGSRGPDGHQWPIPFLAPFSDWQWTWSGQWRLDSWQNIVVTVAAEAALLWLAWKRGFSILESIWPRADAALVAFLRRIVPPRAPAAPGA